MAKKTSKKTRFVALIGLLLVIVVGITVATVPEIRDPIMNMFKVSEPIMLTAFEKETLDNDCVGNDVFFIAGCKYDLENDHRDLSLMLGEVGATPFLSIQTRTQWTLSGDCVGSTFRNVDVQIGLIVDFVEGVTNTCKDMIKFDSQFWELRIIDGIHTFLRINTGYACTEATELSTFPVVGFRCLDENNDGIFDGGYDQLQAECNGILGVDCPLGLTCEFETEFFFIVPRPIESTCVLT